MSDSEKKYYLVENNGVVRVISSEELENIIQKLMNKSSKEDLSKEDQSPVFYSLSKRETDELHKRVDKAKDHLDYLLDKCVSGIIKDGRSHD